MSRQVHTHTTTHSVVRKWLIGTLSLILIGSGAALYAGSGLRNPLITGDPTGILMTYSETGPVDLGNPFFQNLGSNGRRCSTCHQPADAWTVTPSHIRA